MFACVLATMSRNVLKTLKSKEQSRERKYKIVHASLIKKKHLSSHFLSCFVWVWDTETMCVKKENVCWLWACVRERLCVSMCGCVCVCLITIQLRLQVVDLSVKDCLTSHKNHCQITHTGATVYRTHTYTHHCKWRNNQAWSQNILDTLNTITLWISETDVY